MFKGNHTKLITIIIIIFIFILLILFFYFKYRNASNSTPLTQNQALKLTDTSQINAKKLGNQNDNNELQNYLYDLSLIEANLQLFVKIIYLIEGKAISENDVVQLKNTIEYINHQFTILNNKLTQLITNATNNQISILQTTINSINQNIDKINPIINSITGINIIKLKAFTNIKHSF